MIYPNITHAQASAVLAAIPFAGASVYQRADSAASITYQGGTISATGGASLVTVTIGVGGPVGTATFTLALPSGFTYPTLPTAASVAVAGYTLTFAGSFVAAESVQLTPPNAAQPRFKVVGIGGKTFFLNDAGQPAGGAYPSPPVPALTSPPNANGSQPTENVFAMVLAAQQYAQTPIVPTTDADYRLVNNGSGWLVPLT